MKKKEKIEKIEKIKKNNKNILNNYIFNIVIGIVLILIDQLTKNLLINKIITIIPNFLSLNYTENIGGAFGIGNINFITIFSILIIIGIIIFLIKENKKIPNLIPFTLILAGSIGNLIDRISRGFVIDFIDVNLFNFPNFNIADICIVIGVFILLYIYVIKELISKTNNREK